ncbi:MAG: hypothetical protein NVS3B28_19360 [Candidatus Velthaea sp.]
MADTASDPIMQLSPAPVQSDYARRDLGIAFFESRYKKDPADMITPRRLSAEYLQRYREKGDIGDVLRAEAAAKTSLVALPRNNVAGDMALASADIALHRFAAAKVLTQHAYAADPSNPNVAMAIASIDLEMGQYDEAQRLIETNAAKSDISTSVITSRWDEISGHLDEAQRLLVRAMHYADSIYEFPAERRAWFHFRLGELKYLGGDNAGAIASERDAIAIYPNDFYAWQALARIASADKRHDEAEAAAKTAAALVPSPEVLGILADEQTARGETQDAAASRAQIDAVEKLGNAQHVNDRLIAMYFADHNVRTSDAYAIAKRELAVRDDIYAEDTLAWCAAKAGRWDEARRAAQKALRFDTQDPRMQYHAGIIAQHAGDTAEAVKRFNRALALNRNFSATQADDARTRLEALKKG